MTSHEPLLTADEVASELRVDAETVRRWAREGRVAAVRLPGRGWRFRRADLQEITGGEAAIA